MKIKQYILTSGLALCMLFGAGTAYAQDVALKCLQWNILSFEYTDNSGARNNFSIAEAMEVLKSQAPDIVFFNEFETATGRMSSIEKLSECGQSLGMYPYFIFSYVKEGVGAYGNGILSKYPIVNSGSKQLGMHGGSDQRSVGWADILVPTSSKPEGVKVRVVCTHLDHQGSDNVTRLEQAKEVIAWAIQPAVAANIPVVVMGDMNCGPSSSPIAEYEKVGTRLCNNSTTYGNSSKLDYFISFPKGKWSCGDYKIIREDANNPGINIGRISDHWPIMGTAVLQN